MREPLRQAPEPQRLAQAKVIIRSLAPISTTGMTHQDVPALAEQCREQMQRCIDLMEKELQASRAVADLS